jgi:DNA polymerase
MTVADAPSSRQLIEELDAALAWWREAGVEVDCLDDATAWLAEPGTDAEQAKPDHQSREDRQASTSQPAAPPPEETAPAVVRTDFFDGAPPTTLAEFREFWLTAPGLDVIGPRGRVPPRGAASPTVMVLVVDPEADDRETLLSGPQGRLLDRILAATGTSPDSVYVASALPRHTPMADTAALAAGGMDAVLARHIALVSPKRVMAFGTGLAPLLGQDVTSPDRDLREFNMSPALRDALMSEGLDSLMGMPRLKARFWRKWIEWSAKDT